MQALFIRLYSQNASGHLLPDTESENPSTMSAFGLTIEKGLSLNLSSCFHRRSHTDKKAGGIVFAYSTLSYFPFDRSEYALRLYPLLKVTQFFLSNT